MCYYADYREVSELKKAKRKLLAGVMALCMVIGICIPDTKAATSTVKYDGGYGIDDILSQFQFFVSNDVEMDGAGHTVGSIAVGGKLNLSNSFGDAGTVPSYINSHVNGYLGTGWHGSVPIKSNVVYYKEIKGGSTDSNWFENPGYIDMAAAFKQIKSDSKALAESDDAKQVSIKNGSITIDLTSVKKDSEFKISFADFNTANNINIKVPDANWFNKYLCIISVTGANGNDFTFDGYSKIQVNGSQISTALEAMDGKDAEYGKQLNYSGMNLVWNFPDAEGTITAQGLAGHFVIPNATVKVTGEYEGGIIAKSITGGAQGHFYPMSKKISAGSGQTAVTATATFSKKAVSTAGTELAGASMKLTYVAGNNNLAGVESKSGPDFKLVSTKVITWTSTGTPLVLSGLPEGEYILSETGAPSGYKYAADMAFKVTSDGKIYQKSGNSYSTTAVTTLTMVDEAKSGSLKLTGTKKIAGMATTETFEFVVKEGTKEVATGSVTGAGKINFTPITFNEVGVHTYTITEKNLGASDIEYDASTITVSVDVTDDGGKNSDLKATITSIKNNNISTSEIVFTNTNNATPIPTASAKLSVLKVKEAISDGRMVTNPLNGARLRLTHISGDKDLSGVNCTSGHTIDRDVNNTYLEWQTTADKIMLEELPYGEYILSEVYTPSGYQSAEDIKITVDGSSIVTYTKADGTNLSGADITVEMVDKEKIGKLTLTGYKNLTGDSIDETFTFNIEQDGVSVGTAVVDGAGAITFPEFTYGLGDIGKTYTYTITEIDNGTTGMTYDTIARTVKVKITDPGESSSSLKVEILSDSDDLEFTNKYTAPVEKTATAIFSKRSVSADGDELPGASLKLTYKEGSSDLRHVKHIEGPGIAIENNNTAIAWTSTDKALKLSGLPNGKYILEETGAPKGYKYASAIEFMVKDGKVYQKLSSGEYSDTDDANLTMVDEAKAGSIKLTGTKKVVGDAPSNETYKFVVKEGTKQVATGKVTGAGEIEFTTIKYLGSDAIGDHSYTITETAGTTKNMDYDDNSIIVVVRVSDDGKSDELSAEIVKSKSKDIVFTNEYIEPGNLVVTVYDEKSGDTVPGATVEITDPDGDTKEYVTDEDGKITIKDTEPGDYKIETTEVPEGYDVTLGKSETATVKPGETTVHDVYLNNDPVPEDNSNGGNSSNSGSNTNTANGSNSNNSGSETTSTATGGSNSSNTTDTVVDTSDAFNPVIAMLLFIISAIGLIIESYRRRDKE